MSSILDFYAYLVIITYIIEILRLLKKLPR